MTPTHSDEKGRGLSGLMGRVVDGAARVPVTIVYLAVVLVGSVMLGTPQGIRPVVARMLGTGLDSLAILGHWWGPVSASLVANGYLSLVLALALGGCVLALCERMMGSWRTALAFLVTAVAGDVLGAAFQWLLGPAAGTGHGREWLVLDPLTGVAGALMAASAFAGARTRRRIRVLLTVVVVMFLLYRGEPVDVFRAAAVGIGFAFGLALRPGPSPSEWGRSSHHEVRAFLAAVVVTGAIGPVVAALSHRPHGLLAPIALLLDDVSASDPHGLTACSVYAVSRACARAMTVERIGSVGSIALSLLPLLMLLLVAWGVLRGRRFAVLLGIAMNTMLAGCAAYYLGFLPRLGVPGVERSEGGGSWGVAITLGATVVAPAVSAALLIAYRRRFTVIPSRRAVLRYLVVTASSGIGLSVLYIGLGWMLRSIAFDRPVTMADLALDAVERFLPVALLHREIPDFLPASAAGRVLYHGVGPVFWIIAIVAAVRPLLARPASSAQDAARARSILKRHGGDHLAFMTTWPLTSYWFGPDGETAVGYRVVGGVAITVGSAFGAAPARAEAMAGFARHCDDRGWLPVFYSVDAAQWDAYFAGIGWERLVVAEEAVIAPRTWSTTGRRWQDIRTAVNRAGREGLSLEWTRHRDLSRETAAQIADLSEQWAARKSLPELGFTLGGLDELRDPEVTLLLARAGDGTIQAVTSWMPGYRDGRIEGWTLDFMRRRVDGPNGVMEFMIAGAAERAQRDDLSYVSLSAAPLARTTAPDEPESAVETVLAILASSLEPMYGFRSLLAFKRKFHPELRPLLLAYPDRVALPAIGLALLRAYLPGLTVRGAAALLRRARGETVKG